MYASYKHFKICCLYAISQLCANLPFSLFAQYTLQYLPTRSLRYYINELYTSVQSFILRQALCNITLHITFGEPLVSRLGHNICAGELRPMIGRMYADYCRVNDFWVVEQQAFDFRWCHLEATDFDELLLFRQRVC